MACCISSCVAFIFFSGAGADPARAMEQGGSVAHRLFHTRLLPHILLPGSPFGLPDVLHTDALSAAERFGGAEGPLVRSS